MENLNTELIQDTTFDGGNETALPATSSNFTAANVGKYALGAAAVAVVATVAYKKLIKPAIAKIKAKNKKC